MRKVVEHEHLDADHWWFRARRRIFARVLDALPDLPARARVLDVGPGFGVNLPVLAPRGPVTVVDLSRDSLAACARAGAALAVRADGTRPPFAEGSFDLACALDVLEHLDDDAAAMRALRAVLRPRGYLLASVPAWPILWGRQDVLSDHKRRYTRRLFAERLRAAGFALERLSYFNALLFPPILAVRLAMRPFLGRTVQDGGSDLGLRLPRAAEELLYRTFALEAGWLARRDLPLGVSLLAVARPEAC